MNCDCLSFLLPRQVTRGFGSGLHGWLGIRIAEEEEEVIERKSGCGGQEGRKWEGRKKAGSKKLCLLFRNWNLTLGRD